MSICPSNVGSVCSFISCTRFLLAHSAVLEHVLDRSGHWREGGVNYNEGAGPGRGDGQLVNRSKVKVSMDVRFHNLPLSQSALVMYMTIYYKMTANTLQSHCNDDFLSKLAIQGETEHHSLGSSTVEFAPT